MRGKFRRVLPALVLGLATGANAQTLPLTAPLPPPAPLPKEGTISPLAPPQNVGPVAPAPASPAAPTAAAPVPAMPAGPPSNLRTVTTFNPAQRAALERVNAYLNGVGQLIAAFVQVGPDGSRSQGRLYLLKPGKVRFEYDPPSPVELISNGSAVAVRDRKLVTQDIYPLSQTPLRFLLAEKLDLLRDSNVIGVYQDELFITVVIEEKSPVAGTHRLMIMFGVQDNQLKQWTITDPQGYDTTIAVYNLDTSKKPDPRLFEINFERVIQ